MKYYDLCKFIEDNAQKSQIEIRKILSESPQREKRMTSEELILKVISWYVTVRPFGK